MTAQTLYLWFPGTAAEALRFYHDVFGGELALHTYAEFGRTDGPADAVAHGALVGPVSLYGTDAVSGEETLRMSGVSIALLGTADGATLTRWFHAVSDGGTVIDPLQRRSWGAYDGRVVDRYGVSWLIGYEEEGTDETS
ncbi:VOC family protein [Microbacterium oryzae]|uniref:VOC family protein n=1 Tax=Microbacterium oryzae TaxID=743009 RepID=UPI0025AF4DF5|nr:VOC family protein [Microbacterium oryzae]MDN3311755.1 VOC family protein [Microbacterium oryzae]